MAIFGKGLLIEDVRDAANFLGRQDSWLQTICVFVNAEPYEDFRNKIDSYVAEADELIGTGKSAEEVCEQLYADHTSVDDKDFILTLKPEDILKSSSLIVTASDTLRHAICLTEESDNFLMYKSLVAALNYYNNFLSAIIRRGREYKGNYESLVESSCYSLNYFWTDQELVNQRFKSYVNRERVDRASLEDILIFHETNIRVLLTGTDNFSVFGGLQYVREFDKFQQPFLKLLEDFVTKLLTVYQNYCTVESYREIATHARQIIEDANQDDFSMARLDIKVELNALQLVYNVLEKEKKRDKVTKRRDSTKSDLEQLEQQLRMVEELIERHEDEAER